MKVSIFCVYDSKAQAYGQPFFFISREVAQRAFAEQLRDAQSMISKYPGDFTLFELGTFDDKDATFALHAAGLNLGLAAHYQQPTPKGIDS